MATASWYCRTSKFKYDGIFLILTGIWGSRPSILLLAKSRNRLHAAVFCGKTRQSAD